MIERAFVREEIKKPRLSQLVPTPTSKLKNLVPTAIENCFDTQEADAFRMKAISLLRPHGFFDTIQEKISSLQHAPLHKHSENENQITLSQVLQPFPGERIELRGSFLRKDNRTIPVANSFELQRISHVTGFPHPAQHTGWAFPAAFLEDANPLETIRQSLMPGEPLRERAKDWVALKKRVFDRNKIELCGLLKSFVEALTNSSSAHIDSFFSHAVQRHDCYDFICITHAKVAETSNSESPYLSIIQNALETNKNAFKLCAKFELEQFIDCLRRDPISPDETLLLFKEIIKTEMAFLTTS
jgi:hypothetical protein